jgi:phage N-6-adenine-methyltransferase
MTAIQLNLLGGEQTTRTTDDYYTPRWIFDALGLTFDLDVACPPEGPINVPAARWYTAADDGLAQPWTGRVWMNPPYSNPSPWVARFLEHGNGIALLPYSKSKWLQSLWDSDAAIVYIYTIKFERLDATLNGSTPFPLGLWALGHDNIEALAKLGNVR